MLPARTLPGVFIDLGEQTLAVARTSAGAAPCTIEDLGECPVQDAAAVSALLQRVAPRRSGGRPVSAVVGIHPPRRVLRLHPAEPRRLGEADYFATLCAGQLQVDAQTYALAVLQAENGQPFDPTRPGERDLVFCGLPLADLESAQNWLLEHGLYPSRLEIGSVATVGAVIDYAAHAGLNTPVLVLEVGREQSLAAIVSSAGVSLARPVAEGWGGIVPLVKRNLGLKDEASALKLLQANAFDFTSMGKELARGLAREVQALTSFHEVQTGRSVGHLLPLQLPPRLGWLGASLAEGLGLRLLAPAIESWLDARGIRVPSAQRSGGGLDSRWLALFSLMVMGEVTDAEALAQTR